MEPQDDKQLWDILGRVPEPSLSLFFARNVVRKIRQEGETGLACEDLLQPQLWQSSWSAWLSPRAIQSHRHRLETI